MTKKSRLLTALDAHRGRDYETERQKRMAKKAEKKQRAKNAEPQQLHDKGHTAVNGFDVAAALEDMEDEISGSEIEDEGFPTGVALDADMSSDEDDMEDEADVPLRREEEEEGGEEADEEHEDEKEDDEDILMSDIESFASEDREDILLHQRLTINNTIALLKARDSIALPSSLPFSATQAVTSSTPTEIADVHDDLTRELAFYKQCLDGAVEGRARLKKEGVLFSRPGDYFAEMVKTDEHMGKVKARMVEAAASKKAAAEARKQRDLKKFGKQVQIAKEQERHKQKREMLDKINVLKRKRKNAGGADATGANEEDLFDVALDNEVKGAGGLKRKREAGVSKRAKKDAKFGFGGKKRFAKSNDAASSGDMKGFSAKKMKAGGKKTTFRPGKSKRAKM